MDPTHFLELLCASTGLAAGDAAENKDTNHCPYPTDDLVEGQAINNMSEKISSPGDGANPKAGGRGEKKGEEGCPHFTQLLLPAPVQLRREERRP